LNSIKRTTRLLNLNLNSCYRLNYNLKSSSDYTFIFPSILNNVVSLRLASFELPNCWYLFSHKSKNNNFIITITKNGNKCTYSIIIPDGNYNFEQLEIFLNDTYFYTSNTDTYLKYIKFSIDKTDMKSRFEIIRNNDNCSLPDLCDELPDDLPNFLKKNVYDISHNKLSDKLHYGLLDSCDESCDESCIESCENNFCFDLFFLENSTQNIQCTAGWILGFRMASYYDICDIQSEGLYDGCGDKYIYLSLTDYQYNYSYTNIVYFNESVLMDNILAKIPIINGKLSLSLYDNNNPLNKIRVYNGPINLNRITIKLYDKCGNIIDLNYMDYSFTLELEILYENFNFKNINT